MGWSVDPARVDAPVPAPGTLGRDRVDALLEAATERPLTVLQAPTGYGKTTAVADWLTRRRRPAAWLSLDAHDNHPPALMDGLIHAFEMVLGAGALDEVTELLDAGADLALVVLPRLAELVAERAAEPLVLVLDDFDELASEPALACVQSLLNSLAPVLAVVICSQARPSVRLARRLAAGEATVIGAEQLAFTPTETDRLLNEVHALGLSPADLSVLERRNEGWPLGLALLPSALASTRRTGDGSVVTALSALAAGPMLENVIATVMAPLSAPQRRLCLHISGLERVNGPLAAAVTDDAAAPVLLEQLRERGQFVVSDGRPGGWLGSHPLVREALSLALTDDEPELAAVLHQRAARWFEANGMAEEAICHTLMAGPEHRSSLDRLLVAHGLALALEGRTRGIRQALAADPTSSAANPFREALGLLVGLIDGGATSECIGRAWELHRRYGSDAAVGRVTAIIVGSPLVGDVGAALEAGAEALLRWGHQPEFVAGVAPGLAACLMLAGRTSEVRTLVEPLVARDGGPAAILAHTYLAWVCLEEGDATVAEWHGRHAVELLESRFTGGRAGFAWVRAALADALRLNGKLSEAREQVDRCLGANARWVAPMIQGLVLVSDAELALAEMNRTRAAASAERARRILAGCVDVGTAPWRRLQVVADGLAEPKLMVSVGSLPTTGELRVLELLAVTPNRAQIARELYLSESTVKTHLRRIYKRFGAANRDEALAAARARGLIGPQARGIGPTDLCPSGCSANPSDGQDRQGADDAEHGAGQRDGDVVVWAVDGQQHRPEGGCQGLGECVGDVQYPQVVRGGLRARQHIVGEGQIDSQEEAFADSVDAHADQVGAPAV